MRAVEKSMLMDYMLTNAILLENEVKTLTDNMFVCRIDIPSLQELTIAKIKLVSFLQFSSHVMALLNINPEDSEQLRRLDIIKQKYTVEVNVV